MREPLPHQTKTSGLFAFLRVPLRLFPSLKSHGLRHLPLLSLSLCLLHGCNSSRSEVAIKAPDRTAPEKPAAKTAAAPPNKTDEAQSPVRVRPDCPIRLGGVFLRGLGDNADPQEDSATTGAKLSDTNRDWIAANCDVAAFSAGNLQPDTFRQMTRAQKLFTPLLYLYASSLYEQPEHRGNVGGWQPATMSAWTLRDLKEQEVTPPDRGGHWMDFGNTDWAKHWKVQAARLVGQYGAQGVVASELPIGNTFVPDMLQKYKAPADRLGATTEWLRTARSPRQFLLVPSSVGFDALAGHPTLPTPPGTEEPELAGRVWDELFPFVNGAWAEGWVIPHWSGETLPNAQWERHIEAADRADRNDQVFIACAAYHDDNELEYVLASFLMAYHRQGRACLQPMPLRAGQPPDAGYSLAVFRKEITDKANFFNPPLGVAKQERHPLRVEGGDVWRRQFQGGDVYVNSDDTRAKTLRFSGNMRRLNGDVVREVEMAPHTGVILLNMKQSQP